MSEFVDTFGYTVGDLIKVIVIAYNSQGPSDYEEITDGLLVEGKPQPPSGFEGTAITDSSIRVTWTAINMIPSTSNGFTQLTSYEVWRYNATDPHFQFSVSPFSNFYVDTLSLVSSQTY